jgi:5-(carboxyamino)imidazole ribonucleotide synthase
LPLIYEEFIPFDFEVSAIGARNAQGQTALYPLNHNLHREGILRLTRAPFDSRRLQSKAQGYLQKLLQYFAYQGVLNIEFFVKGERLLANELAPRVHNSGHWTIEGAATSQFENHLRAILNLPLGSTAARGYSAMINLIGSLPPRDPWLAIPELHWHDYGKTPRPGRKVGHVTVLAQSAMQRDRLARKLLKDIAQHEAISPSPRR